MAEIIRTSNEKRQDYVEHIEEGSKGEEDQVGVTEDHVSALSLPL
jgi:hypothetical protein